VVLVVVLGLVRGLVVVFNAFEMAAVDGDACFDFDFDVLVDTGCKVRSQVRRRTGTTIAAAALVLFAPLFAVILLLLLLDDLAVPYSVSPYSHP
jgi:hypothetical protein